MFEPQQEIQVLWGTPTPVMLMMAGGMAQVRAKGACDFIVIDADAAGKQYTDSEGVSAKLRSEIVTQFTDAIMAYSRSANKLDELMQQKDEIIAKMSESLSDVVSPFGLAVQAIEIVDIQG